MNQPVRIEPHQMFAQFIDTVNRRARRVAAAPQDFPKPPDLIAELDQCAVELGEAGRILGSQYPRTSECFYAAQRRVLATIAKFEERSHVRL